DNEDDVPRVQLGGGRLANKGYQEAAGELREKEQARNQHFTREVMLVPAELSEPS
ncbi:segregation and condensation protein A, partial [Lactiplantibacillus plantarum]